MAHLGLVDAELMTRRMECVTEDPPLRVPSPDRGELSHRWLEDREPGLAIAETGIESIAEAVAERVDNQDGQHDCMAREDRHLGVVAHH